MAKQTGTEKTKTSQFLGNNPRKNPSDFKSEGYFFIKLFRNILNHFLKIFFFNIFYNIHVLFTHQLINCF